VAIIGAGFGVGGLAGLIVNLMVPTRRPPPPPPVTPVAATADGAGERLGGLQVTTGD